MFVTFGDGIKHPMLVANGYKERFGSPRDTIVEAERETIEFHFDSMEIQYDALRKYYLDSENFCGALDIEDDSGNVFTHKDYVIGRSLGMSTLDGDVNPRIILKLSQLTEIDKSLREITGGRKVYMGTPLQIAINRKIDEISDDCQKAIFDGVDVGDEHYSLTLEDQKNMEQLEKIAEKGMNVAYHADGEPCRVYSAAEWMEIMKAVKGHVTHCTTYSNLLSRYVETLTDIPVIEAVKFGETQLIGEYAEMYEQCMQTLAASMNA